MANPAEPTEATTPPPADESYISGTRSQEEGFEKLLAPALATREGARILIFGRTRWGKSTLAESLIQAMLQGGVASTAIIHDVKYPDRQQYTGAPVYSQDQLGPTLAKNSIAVLRPPIGAALAAETSRRLTEGGEPTALLFDETRRALAAEKKWIDSDDEAGHANKGPKNIEWHFLEAGGVRGSVVLLLQIPRAIPGHAIDSAQFYVFCGLAGPSLNYAVDARIVPPEAADTVRRLPPGAFCIFSATEDWDHEVYYSPLPAGG
jgi:hypothetical protein